MGTLVENFDSYTDGDLNGQGGWSGSVNWDVQGTIVQSGVKAVQCAISASTIDKSITASANGNQVFYIRSNALNVGATNHSVRFYEGATYITGIYLNEGGGSPGDILLDGSASDPIVATWVINTWYKIEVEWRTSDDSFRARVNDGTWTSWTTVPTAFANIDKIRLQNADATGSTFFVDSFSDPNAVTTSTQKPISNMLLMGV